MERLYWVKLKNSLKEKEIRPIDKYNKQNKTKKNKTNNNFKIFLFKVIY